MNVLGVIVEYNPFHNGHLYHLNSAKEISNADLTICVMSSNFIQRGEPSIINKWARAKMALLAGVDIVIELPVIYSMSSAEYFSYASVKILDRLNVVTHLCFGSESGSIDNLSQIADVLVNEDSNFSNNLKEALKSGDSYPKAREKALLAQLENLSHEIKPSNNILGIEYLKALRRLNSSIKPLTITRVSNSYNQPELSGSISSATSIRKNIHTNGVINAMPKFAYDVMQSEFSAGRGPVCTKDFEDIILGLFRRMNTEQIQRLPFVCEGLDNRLKKCAHNAGSIEEFLNLLQTKRYTNTRLQRIILSALTGVTSCDLSTITKAGGSPYARLLGFSKNGELFLKNISQNTTIPLITNLKTFQNSSNTLIKRVVDIEQTSTDCYVLGYKKTDFRKAGQEFTSKIVTL